MVTVTYDTDYEPDPPENSLFPDYVPEVIPLDDPFWSIEDDQYMTATYTIKYIQGASYDELPVSPDEMRYEGTIKEVDEDWESIVPDLPFNGGFSGGRGHIEYVVLSRTFSCFCSGTHTVQLYIHFWEEDDGFFTGSDDDLGTVTTSAEVPCCSPDSGTLSHMPYAYFENNDLDQLQVFYELKWTQFGAMN